MESKEKTTFDTIYNANVEIVYKVALKYAQNHHIAEEIAQSVFMKFFTLVKIPIVILVIYIKYFQYINLLYCKEILQY